MIEAPYMPAAGALTPELVEEKDLAAANGLFSTLENVTVVIGPLIGGLLLVLGSPVAGILVNSATFFAAAVIVSRLRARSRGTAHPGTGMLRQWWDGLTALASRRVAFILVGFCALDSAIYGASSVIYVPLSVHLGTGLEGYGYLLAGSALGGVVAAALANRLSSSPRLSAIIVGSIFLQAVPFALTAATQEPAVAFVLQVISGVGMIIVDILALSALQRDVESGVLSRVLAVFGACVTIATMAGSLGFAYLLQSQGLDTTLVVIGTLFPFLALCGLPTLLAGERHASAQTRRIAPLADLLSRLDVFTGSPRSVLERLAMAAEEQSVDAGALLIREGDPADAFWVLAEGELAVESRGGEATPRALPPVSAPGYVGELGLMHETPRTATVTASAPSRLFRIDGQEFLAALEAAPPTTAFVQLTGLRWERTPAGFGNRRTPAQPGS
jgi:MFS family permease